MKKFYSALFLVISQALALNAIAQYCTPSYTGYGYWNGAQNVKNTPSSFFTHLKM
jgi:hypothetical protein